jgi:hypothetical protein
LKKNPPPAPSEPWDDPPLGTHGYGVAMVHLVVQLVGTGVALRAVPRVLQRIAAEWGGSGPIPHWTTVRLWMQGWGMPS